MPTELARTAVTNTGFMDFSYPTVLIVPLGLGLLGFLEPCAVGAHLIFLRAIAERRLLARALSTLIFAAVRIFVMGSFGALVALLGQQLIHLQTTLWLVFGALYLLIGGAYAVGRSGAIARRIDAGPRAWKLAGNPLVLGLGFGLSIPACAAPILFGLIAMAASSGAAALGFATMAVFGLALSVPLAALALSPAAASLAVRLERGGAAVRWVIAAVFVGLGVWSIWFGLFLDPADWASQ